MRLVVCLVVMGVSLLGCNGSPAPSPTAPDSTTSTTDESTTTSDGAPGSTLPVDDSEVLRVGTTAPLTNLDPADAFTFGDWEVLNAVGGGLLEFEPGSGAIVPGLAEDLPEVSEDGRTYTFQLRDDIEYPDGTTLTAPDYVEGVDRVMNLGGRGSDLISLYVARIEAPDETTVVFELRDAYSFFPVLVTGAPYLAFHPDAYPADELAQTPETPLFGAGHWYIESRSPQRLVLEENPGHLAEDGAPRRIILDVFETAQDMTTALTAGDVDMIWRGIDAPAADSLSEVDELNVSRASEGTVHFLTVNHGESPTSDHLVRQALARLVDRGAIIDSALGEAFEPAYSPIPSGFAGSIPSFREVYGEPDVAGAIELLTEAGYSDTDRAEIELAYPPERFGLDIAAAMDELALQIEATGLASVTITAQPWNTYVGSVVDGDYDLAFLGWLHDFPDPHNYLASFVLDGGLGGSGINLAHPDIPELVEDAAREADPDERASLYGEIQELFADDVVTLPLWVEHGFIAYRDRVSGSDEFPNPESLNLGPNQLLHFEAIELDENG
ncbi:MAG: ABC transporter substrate-binding protein [Actinomycetota bacterium]